MARVATLASPHDRPQLNSAVITRSNATKQSRANATAPGLLRLRLAMTLLLIGKKPPRLGAAPLFRRDHHGHLAAFHARVLLDLGDGVEIALDAHQHIHAELLVRELTTAEAHRDLHLVAFVDEALHAAHLDVVIVIVDARAQLDLFDLDHLLLFTR